MNKDDVARPEVFSRAIVHLQKELQKALDDATTLSAENEKLRRALREAPAALNAMAAKRVAEFRDHDKAAARHDAIVMAFKKKVRQALAGDDHGHR